MTSATLGAATTTGARQNKHRRATTTSRGVSALMYASQQGDVDAVKTIIQEQPAALLTRDRTGKTPLHYCCTSDNICAAQAADLLVMAAPDLVESRDEDGFTPLHLAVIAGNMPLVTFLLANNADINAVDNEKHTVVHWATVCGETAALRAVLAAKAPVSTPDVHGGYPLHYAAQMCGGDKDSTLGLQVLQTLLSHSDINVSVQDGDGRQPLLWAASAGSAKAVLALIRAGATVEAADKDGLTALHCAASRGHTDCIDSLLTLCGASPDVIDSNGCTALHYAVTLGHTEATALLLAHGADPNRQDRKGRTSAHCGCAKGQFETVKIIGAHGANLWLRNARGDLPLHEAAASGRRDLVRWLLDIRPSQVNARNNDGRCPLHLAALNDNADMCKILLDAGAQVNPVLRTSKNTFMTPLDCALQRGFRSTAKYLQLHGGVPANRLRDIRHSHVTSGPKLQIKDDVAFWGDTSSDSERENGEVTRHSKRIQRKKLAHKYDKKRASLSGSDAENNKFAVKFEGGRRRRFGEKNQRTKYSERTNSAASSDLATEKKRIPSTRIDYTNEIVINGKTEININNTKQVTVNEDVTTKLPSKLSTEVAEKVLREVPPEKEKRPKSAKTVKARDKSAKSGSESTKKKTKSERLNSKQKSGEESKEKESSEIKTTEKTETEKSENAIEKNVTLEETQENKKQKLADQQSLMSNTSEEIEEHKSLIVEAAIHEPPKTQENVEQQADNEDNHEEILAAEEKKSEELVQETSEALEDNNDKQQDKEEKNNNVIEKKDSVENEKEVENQRNEEVNGAEEDEEEKLNQKEEEEEKLKQKEDVAEPDDVANKDTKEDGGDVEGEIVAPVPQEHDQEEAAKKETEDQMTESVKNEEETKVDSPNGTTVETTNEEKNADLSDEVKTEAENEEEIKADTVANISAEETNKTLVDENQTAHLKNVDNEKEETTKATEDNISEEAEVSLIQQDIKDVESMEGKTTEETEISANGQKNNEENEVATRNEDTLSKEVIGSTSPSTTQNVEEIETSINNEIVQNEKPKKQKPKKKHRRERKTTEDQAYEIIYKTLGAEEEDEITERLDEEEAKHREKLKQQKTISEDEYTTDLETDSSTSTSITVKEHKSFRILDDKEAEELESKKPKPKKVPRKTKGPPKKQRSRSEENKKVNEINDAEKIKKSKISKSRFSKSDKYLDVPDRKTKSSMESRVPSLPNINESKDRFREPPRSDSNMSAPLLASAYSDEEVTASELDEEAEEEEEEEEQKTGITKRRKVKKKLKSREARSAGSDYESSNVVDSGFEPSPRSSRIPKWKNMSERGVNMTSVTQSIQANIRRYHLERKIFQHLLDLKRLQIRAGQHNEAILVKRAIDAYHHSCASTVGAGRYVPDDYTFKSFEKFLYLSLRKLQKNGSDYLKGLPESPANPLLCTQSTHRCMHATHAYTGIPCAAYLPKMNHHTIPKIGFASTQCKPGTGFLPTINQKKAVTLELCHGNDKQVISLPADRLDQNKRYYVTFTVKGNETTTPPNEESATSGHRHSKSD